MNKPLITVTLTTVPDRLEYLSEQNGVGPSACLKTLCEQSYENYEVHFNIPYVYKLVNRPYVIPKWLEEFQVKYPHLKVFRTDDYGAPTKLIPTLLRINDPEAIIIVVDDDLIYHKDLVLEHYNHSLKTEFTGAAFGYDGRGNLGDNKYDDLRDCWINCVERPTPVLSIQHYKSVSYRRKYFESDFFEHFVGKTLNDDHLVSKYFEYKQRKIYVLPYGNDPEKVRTYEDWYSFQCVETFPVIRHAGIGHLAGCRHPEMEKLEREKFFDEPALFKKWVLEKKISY